MCLKYDLHTHILPGIDDGAKNVEESVELIEALKAQKIENICLTPHLYTHKESVEDFLRRRSKAFCELRHLLPDSVNVKLGAEVYVTQYLFAEEQDLRPLCIEGTNYMITEFSYKSTFSGESMRQILRLRDFGIIPVIPHVERYPALMKNKELLEELIYMGIIIQSNFVSFTEPWLGRKLLKLLKSGYIHVLSTDVHSFSRNAPVSVRQAVEIISKKCPADIIQVLNQNAKDIFEGS